ncbi:hypothetical protein [Pseudoalteromonas sp. G4]|uniref:hypothetical protein n=1 Tax=Pseudoalteromonas sp. G4 TaxID=2992761 RepID=UPI00237ECBF6|nr:hypothetical protein [Pseudoalteromonas sp. G4]MDE3272521.1 hypothetical protein [Pseudoalteromonas sp. G4]
MCRKNKLIMRVVLSELMTNHPKPIKRHELVLSGVAESDVDTVIDYLTQENYVSCDEQGHLILSSEFEPNS